MKIGGLSYLSLSSCLLSLTTNMKIIFLVLNAKEKWTPRFAHILRSIKFQSLGSSSRHISQAWEVTIYKFIMPSIGYLFTKKNIDFPLCLNKNKLTIFSTLIFIFEKNSIFFSYLEILQVMC